MPRELVDRDGGGVAEAEFWHSLVCPHDGLYLPRWGFTQKKSIVDLPRGFAEFPLECPATADLWGATAEWPIEADGGMTREYGPEDDRMFNGDTLSCRGWLTRRKARRADLVFVESGGTGGADDS